MDYIEYRYFYSKLNPREKELCRIMYDGFCNGQSRFKYDLSGINIKKLLNSIWYDFPELYFVNMSSFSHYPDEIWLNSPKPFIYTESQRREIDKKLNSIVMSFFAGTDFEKELAVHNYLTSHSVYNLDYKKVPRDSLEFHEDHSLVGPLIRGSGVCSGIAKAAQYILTRLGVYSIYCSGDCWSTKEDTPGGHAWLMVRIDGDFYHLDMSHDVCGSMEKRLPSYTYFNVTDREISRNHSIDDGLYPDIKCTATKYNYHRKYGRYFSTAEEMKKALFAYLENFPASRIQGSIRFDFRMADAVDESVIKKIFNQALSCVSNSKSCRWSCGLQNVYVYEVCF